MVHLVTPSLALVGAASAVVATLVVALLGWGPQLMVEQRRTAEPLDPREPQRSRSPRAPEPR